MPSGIFRSNQFWANASSFAAKIGKTERNSFCQRRNVLSSAPQETPLTAAPFSRVARESSMSCAQ